MATSQELARAQRLLADRQRQLERLDQVRAAMVAEIERSAKQLEQLQSQAEQVLNQQLTGTLPHLSTRAEAQFRDQYQQFATTSPVTVKPPSQGATTALATPQQKSPVPNPSGTFSTMGREALPQSYDQTGRWFNQADDRVNWQMLTSRNPEKTYISGTYVRTINGNPINGKGKQYEYELTAGALPMSVGEEIVAPVHPGGHNHGMLGKKTNLIFRVDSIYEGRKYFGEHDRIEEKVTG